MRPIGRIGRIGTMGLIGMIGFFLLFLSARAASPVSLTVSPLFYDLQVNPGETKEGELYIGNNSEQDLAIGVELSDFFVDDAGNYIFSEDKEIQNEQLRPYLMKDWLSVDKPDFILEKGKSEVVKYKISIPEDAVLGGHYGAIFFRTRCEIENDENVVFSDKSNVCVSGRAGVLFLVQAGGEAVKRGELKKVEMPGVSFSDKSKLAVEISNTGNTHFKPEGLIAVKNLFGREISRVEIKDKTILPTTSRVFSEELRRKDFLGFYKISGNIKDGEGQDMRFQKFTFLIPWKELLAVLALIGAWIWFLKRYKISLRSGASK